MSQIVHFTTAEADVKRVVGLAATIVAELELDGDLKVPAFEKAVDLLAGEPIVVEPQQTGVLGMPPLRQG